MKYLDDLFGSKNNEANRAIFFKDSRVRNLFSDFLKKNILDIILMITPKNTNAGKVMKIEEIVWFHDEVIKTLKMPECWPQELCCVSDFAYERRGKGKPARRPRY